MALPKKKKQPVKINLKQFVTNPYAGSAFLASRKVIKAGLQSAFIKLLREHRTKFYAVPYVYPNGDVLFHVRVPSGDYKYNKLHYDVIFKIENDPTRRYSMRNVRMFSNSPSFVFTYAYVLYNSDLMVEEFALKLPIMALTVAPEIRNPVESLGYERSTYIAARYLIDGHALTDDYIKRYGKKMNVLEQMNLSQAIGDAEQIVQIYSLGQQLQAKNSKIDKKRTADRKKLQKDFTTKAKKNEPTRGTTGRILGKKKPRAKITARKATRSTRKR